MFSIFDFRIQGCLLLPRATESPSQV